jgi:predicted membrane protein
MRVGFVFNGIFWGGVLIVLGLLAIVKAVFHLNISLFRIGFALLIIYMGVSMLLSRPHFDVENNTVLFGDRQLFLAEQDEYNVIFGRGSLDLSALNNQERTRQIGINVVFGEGEIKINPDLPMKIKVSSFLAMAELPDGNQVTMGEYTYQTPSYAEDPARIQVEANVVFGNLVFSE